MKEITKITIFTTPNSFQNYELGISGVLEIQSIRLRDTYNTTCVQITRLIDGIEMVEEFVGLPYIIIRRK